MSTDDKAKEVIDVVMIIWASAVATQNPAWHSQYLKDLKSATDVESRMRVDIAFDRQTDMLRDIGAVTATTEEIYQKAIEIVEEHALNQRYGPASVYGSSLVDKTKVVSS